MAAGKPGHRREEEDSVGVPQEVVLSIRRPTADHSMNR
jgi:hypothetical protein